MCHVDFPDHQEHQNTSKLNVNLTRLYNPTAIEILKQSTLTAPKIETLSVKCQKLEIIHRAANCLVPINGR